MRRPTIAPSLESVLSGLGDGLYQKLSQPEYIDFSRDMAHKYYHYHKLRFIARARKLDPDAAWALEKMRRMPQLRKLPLRGMDDKFLRYSIPSGVQEQLMLVDQQLAGEFAAKEEQPLPGQKERFIISALREEAIASSMLEGAVTTRVDAKNMLQSGRKPKTRGEKMVLNNYRAIDFIRENKDVDLSPDFLLELQKILTIDTLDDPGQVGRFRNPGDTVQIIDDRDGEVMHDPPVAEELPLRLDELCEFANHSHRHKNFIHPVLKACILHFQIGFDHPFCDGNGRTARAIFYWSMLRSGYWLFEYLPISRLIFLSPGRYARAFIYSETDDFDITYFLVYNMKIVERARKEFNEYVERKISSISEARRLYAKDNRLNHRQREIVLQATRNQGRLFNIAKHKSNHSVSYETARSDLLELEEWGYLSKFKNGNRYEFTAGGKIIE